MSDRPRRPRRTTVLRLALAAALLATACEEAPVAPSDGQNAPKAAIAPAPRSETPAAIPLSDIPREAGNVEALRRDIVARLAPDEALREASTQLAEIESRLVSRLRRPGPSAAEEVQVLDLQEFDTDLHEMDAEGLRIESALEARARMLDDDLAQVETLRRRWAATIPAVAAGGAPEAIRERSVSTLASLDNLSGDVKRGRDEALVLLDRSSRIRSELASARAEAAERRSKTQRRLLAFAEEPLWRTAWAGRPIGRAAAERLSREFRRLQTYVARKGPARALLFLLVFAGTLALFLGLRGPALECARVDPYARAPLRMIERPLAAAILTALFALARSTARMAPVLFYDIAWVLLMLATAVLLGRLLGRPARRTIYTLTVVSCLYPLRYLTEQDPLLDRIVLIVQAGALGAALTADLIQGRWKAVFPQPRRQRLAAGILLVSLVLLSVSLGAAVVGYVGTARVLRNGVLASLGLGLISLGAISLIYAIVSTLLVTRAAQVFHVVQRHSSEIRLFARRLLLVLGTAQWVVWVIFSFGVNEEAARALQRFLGASFAIGSATIAVSGILTFLAVLAVTFLVASVVRFFLEGELFPRLHLPRGLPFTISTTVRYVLLVAGVLLALSAAGINLSRMTLLAGALGVGIGFGLQNLVSNFVSGLILLFERPIQVGDFVDVGSLTGQVRRIGIRSSTVQTGEGAEVIVPNADLISKSVINWTLSDQRRRIEIKVGVAYGSDPERVIGLLLKAASDHPESLAEPAPTAYFVGFGDSSLDFVLQLWVARFEQATALESAARRAVHRVLAEAGIEIPFPQRDLNLKSVALPVAEALRGEKEKVPDRA